MRITEFAVGKPLAASVLPLVARLARLIEAGRSSVRASVINIFEGRAIPTPIGKCTSVADYLTVRQLYTFQIQGRSQFPLYQCTGLRDFLIDDVDIFGEMHFRIGVAAPVKIFGKSAPSRNHTSQEVIVRHHQTQQRRIDVRYLNFGTWQGSLTTDLKPLSLEIDGRVKIATPTYRLAVVDLFYEMEYLAAQVRGVEIEQLHKGTGRRFLNITINRQGQIPHGESRLLYR